MTRAADTSIATTDVAADADIPKGPQAQSVECLLREDFRVKVGHIVSGSNSPDEEEMCEDGLAHPEVAASKMLSPIRR